MKKVSIVIPIYNESNLSVLVPRLFALKDNLPNNTFEFIFVDDGSEDNSLEDLLNF